MDLLKSKCLVIKIGSSTLINEEGKVREQWLDAFAQDVASLRARGAQVIVVSSGAVALGRKLIGFTNKNIRLEEKQAAAACGQILLTQAWREALEKHKLRAAQLLLTIDDSENRRRYLNARNTLEVLLEQGVIPVINENDTVATAELRFGDNDRLAARVAQMASADTLVLFSDVDGLYTGNPHKDATAKHIPEVREITREIEGIAGASASDVGSGGMITKIEAAKIALAAGCSMAIAKGEALHPLKALEEGGKATWFVAASSPVSARKHWISGSIAPAGTIVIDDGAVEALRNGKSLLPAGVKDVEGSFERGDAVLIRDQNGHELGKGLIAYNNDDATLIIGQKTSDIEAILGYKGRNVLIHRDDLVLR
jgi:glutamate 5-kinase